MKKPISRSAAIGVGITSALIAATLVAVPSANAATTSEEPHPPLGIWSATDGASLGGITPMPVTGADGRIITGPNDPGADDVAAEVTKQLESDPQAVQDLQQKLATLTNDTTVKPAPAAKVPNPLDFDSYPDDPADYGIPAAADKYLDGDTYTIPRPTAGGPSAGSTVAGLEDFYGQQLTWEPCQTYEPSGGSTYDVDGVECTYLIVPVDYSNPQGPTAAIGLLKYPAADESKKIGSLFMDPGGPGGSGMELAANLASAGIPEELHNSFDVIGFDPRGVSSSLPMIRCKSSAAFDAQREGSDLLTSEQLDRIRDHNTQDCYDNTGKAFGIDGENFIANVGTNNVVRDLDIARAAVGDAKLNYLGYSYGTSIGYQYAMAFPENIRAVVLDGVVNPLENNPSELAKYSEYLPSADVDPQAQIKGFQATFEQFLKQCAADDGFDFSILGLSAHVPCALGTSGDIAEMTKNYQEIAQLAWGGTYYETQSEENPADRRPLSFADMTQGTIMALYSESSWSYLNVGLANLKAWKDAGMMMKLADTYYNRDNRGQYTFSDSAFQTIWCTDAGVTPGASGTDALREQYKVAPFTDPGNNPDGTPRGVAGGDWCGAYKTQFTLPKGQTLTAMPNVLVISTTYDPATPYQDGVVAADAIGGTLLTVAGASHTSFLGSSQCTDDITIGYLKDLVVATDIPGNQDVETKDIHSNVVTGNECQVTSFRATPKIDAATVVAGDSGFVTASGLVRGAEYDVALPAGVTLFDPEAPARVRADENGTVTFEVLVSDDAQPGDFPVKLTPLAGENDPLVKPASTLTVAGVRAGEGVTLQKPAVLVPASTPRNTPSVPEQSLAPGAPGETPTQPVPGTTPAQPEPGASQQPEPGTQRPTVPGTQQPTESIATVVLDKDGKPVTPTKNDQATAQKEGLASTGADLSPVLGASILLLIAAGGTLMLVQRRRSAR